MMVHFEFSIPVVLSKVQKKNHLKQVSNDLDLDARGPGLGLGEGGIGGRGGLLYRTVPVAKLPLHPILLLRWKFPGGCMFSIKSQSP